ncbi:MAG: hypothetical protein AB1540_10500 [Bdellovibrionota bacterium]
MGKTDFAPILLLTIALTSASCSSRSNHGKELAHQKEDHELGLFHIVTPTQLEKSGSMPNEGGISEVIRVGARALEWLTLLQKNTPMAQRTQVWKKESSIGREFSPEYPLIYNDAIILEEFNSTFARLPLSAQQVLLDATIGLPESAPSDVSHDELIGFLSAIFSSYSQASRWLSLYDKRDAYKQGPRDVRPWLKLRDRETALKELIWKWDVISPEERMKFVDELAGSCPFAVSKEKQACIKEYERLAESMFAGTRAFRWLNELIRQGKERYEEKFAIKRANQGLRTSSVGALKKIELGVFGIDRELLQWMQEQIAQSWNFPGLLTVELYEAQTETEQSLVVEWKSGEMPRVPQTGGNVIVMDANTPRWLEYTNVTFRHEFGHILGFGDCYTEFWDEELRAFTFYSFDPTNAMCALSGDYQERHYKALVERYF